ncbi:MAG: hypothetical protein OEV28_03090 [Nitrospirota bacterium]|nr:hypothetical protein [Nitrospirota bacterium]
MKIAFLMERGNPPRLNPIMAETFARLGTRGAAVKVIFAEEVLLRLDEFTVADDLYLLKSDSEMSLSLANALETMGGRVMNSVNACMLAKDKVMAAVTMARAGIPGPHSIAASAPAFLSEEVKAGPLIFKPHRGYHGVGIAVADSVATLPEAEAYPGISFAQKYFADARRDLKICAIGDEIFGIRKEFTPDSYLKAGVPERLSPEVEDIARRCGEAFGLELYGLDIAETETGPRIIDVNYFPGYRGVPDAARRLADFIMKSART